MHAYQDITVFKTGQIYPTIVNKRWRKSKVQLSRMDNAEKQTTLGTGLKTKTNKAKYATQKTKTLSNIYDVLKC